MGARTIILFAKYPEPGNVKSRLAAHIGHDRAAALYRAMVDTVVARTTPPTVGPIYDRILYFDPPDRHNDFRRWLPQIPEQRPQCDGDLGTRMQHAFAACLADDRRLTTDDAQRVCLIGTDCPTITAADIVTAFARLDAHDVVIGPARDGGYYLLGLRHCVPELFRGVAWSTAHVYTQTLAIADGLRLRTSALSMQQDIDTIEDLAVSCSAGSWRTPQ